MSPHFSLSILRGLALVSALSFLPSSALAQAGLTSGGPSGDEIAARNSKFDKGLNSQSALGQLEEMTGTKVDRSSNQSVDEDNSRVAQQPRVVKPRYDADAAFRQELQMTVASTVADALINSLFSDDSAQRQAAAEAAQRQAAAQAEAFRVQQELARQAHIQQAQHYRADWDSRDAEVGERLDGAFEVKTGNSFFGQPANPDASTIAALLSQPTGGDTSVVDLRGGTQVTPPPPAPAPAGSLLEEGPAASPMPGETARKIAGLGGYFVPELKEYYKGVAQSTAKETAWGLAEDIPYQPYAKALVEFEENRREYTDKLKELNEHLIELSLGRPEALVYAAVHGDARFSENYWEQLPHEVGKLTVEYMKLAYNSIASHASLDLGKLRPPVDTGGY